MSTRISSFILTLAAVLMGSLCGLSQTTGGLKTLRGSVHPLAALSTDTGLAADSKPLSNLKIYIAPTPTQRVALEKLLVDQRTSGTSSYHQWLTPEQFGEKFGISNSNEAKVRSWLEAQGFTGVSLSRSRNVFSFSSTVGQASSIFHTSIHTLRYKGQEHFANTSNVSLPASISNLVLAVAGLNDFRPTPQHVVLSEQPRPQYTTMSDGHFSFAPGDIALEYDLNRLYSSGIDGAGITAVVIGQSDIDLNDIRAYRAAFNLPANDPQVLLVPGSQDLGFVEPSRLEGDLDLELLGAVARGANLLYVQASDVDVALQYAIDQNLGSVISFSYGGSEYIGETWGEEQATYELLAQQANAQGITILAASGDTGATEEDFRSPATHGMVVDEPADIPEVTGVGGTSLPYGNTNQFNQLFSTTNDAYGTSLLAYTPEVTWNDSVMPDSYQNGALIASGGGKSLLFPKPAWQQGPGVPADDARDVPDVSMYSVTSGYGYIICYAGDCPSGVMPDGVNSGTTGAGTSASTPVFAGVVVLLNQYLLQNGKITSPGLGNINPNLYQLAIDAPDAFHDITQGNNMVPCQIGSPDCTGTGAYGTEGYNAGAGYDLATGLGSVDAYNLAYDWSSYSPAATTLTLTANPQPVTVGQNITLKATVAAGSGTPSGTVSFYSVAAASFFQATLLGTQAVGSDGIASFAAGTVQSNAGAYYAEYSGATGYSPSLGGPVTVVMPTATTLVASSTQIAMGSSLTLTANVTVASGEPTGGTVTFMDGTISLGSVDLSGGESSLSISTLSAGSHSITATYQPLAGNGYGTSTSAPITVAVVAQTTTTTLAASSSQVDFGSPLTLTANVTAASGEPTGGTVTFMDGATSLGSIALSGGESSFSISTLSAGFHSITATYQPLTGNGYGTSTSAPITVKVNAPVPVVIPTTTTLAASSSQIALGSSFTLTASVTAASGKPTGGTVIFMDGTTSLGSIPLSGGESSLSNSTLSAGSHSITATYQPLTGSSYEASTSTSITVKVNAPDFTLSATPTSFTVSAGSTASTTLNIAPLYSFSGSTPTMSCSGLPSGASCVFGTSAMQADGSTNIPLSITTATTTADAGGIHSRSGFCLAFLPLLFCLGRRRKAFVRALSSFVLFAAIAVIGLGASGCGGKGAGTGGGQQGGNTPTTSVVTVKASSSGITHQVQITLTVN